MPYINVKTNTMIPIDKEENIKTKIGQEITLIGKTEDWLMVDFNDNCHLYFKGSTFDPIAYVEVKLYGSSTEYNELTGAITSILEDELGIKPDHVYVSYFETKNWGYDSSNF